jgi:hypothetical protein
MPRPQRHSEHVRLLHGPYTAPGLRRGDKATCLLRDGEVLITGWSDARISWPRCRLPGTHGGGSGLLVEDELARAVRSESSLAIQHWWGVNFRTVWCWRKALGVPPYNEGTTRLHAMWNKENGARLRGKKLPPEQVERRRRTALELGLRPPAEVLWTAEELALLGTMPDEDVAARIGRTATGVRVKRSRCGIPNPAGPWWTAEETALLGTLPGREVAQRLGRSLESVRQKRKKLGIGNRFWGRKGREAVNVSR